MEAALGTDPASSRRHLNRQTPVWVPRSEPDKIPMNQYRYHVNRKFNQYLKDSQQLQKWSVTDPQAFWVDLWSYVGLIPDLPSGTTRAYDPAIPIDKVPPFFEGVEINYAENVLTQPRIDPESPALIQIREGQGIQGEVWSWASLREKVRQVRSALIRSGVKEGDRVAALISTSSWSVAIFLAAASIGAIFSSIAAELGEKVCAFFGLVTAQLTGSGMRSASSADQTAYPVCGQSCHL